MPQVVTKIPDREKIRELRMAAGLTPDRLAYEMPGGHHPQTIRRIESAKSWGNARCSVYLLRDIAQFFKVTIADITVDEDPIAA